MPEKLSIFHPIEWLAFLIDVQADKSHLISESTPSPAEILEFNLKVAALRDFFLSMEKKENAA